MPLNAHLGRLVWSRPLGSDAEPQGRVAARPGPAGHETASNRSGEIPRTELVLGEGRDLRLRKTPISIVTPFVWASNLAAWLRDLVTQLVQAIRDPFRRGPQVGSDLARVYRQAILAAVCLKIAIPRGERFKLVANAVIAEVDELRPCPFIRVRSYLSPFERCHFLRANRLRVESSRASRTPRLASGCRSRQVRRHGLAAAPKAALQPAGEGG